MDHKITIKSPLATCPNPSRYAEDPYYQHMLLSNTFSALLQDPFETSRDLRGAEIRVTLHDDGLHATAELVAKPLPEPDREMFEAAERILARQKARMRRMETVDLLDLIRLDTDKD